MKTAVQVTAPPEALDAIAAWLELGDRAEEIIRRYPPHMRDWFELKTPGEIVRVFAVTTIARPTGPSRSPRPSAAKRQTKKTSAAADGDRPRLNDASRRLGVAMEWHAAGDRRGAMRVIDDLRRELDLYLTRRVAA
jgi:hypothetical protein